MSRTFWFEGGDVGEWQVIGMKTLRGEPLEDVTRVNVTHGDGPPPQFGAWRLSGVTSNLRYTDSGELNTLRAHQPDLGRLSATYAALIPIKKSASWWDMPQDARLAIFSQASRHTAIGLDYLPQIARRLHHCHDLGGSFDFLTWFEYERIMNGCSMSSFDACAKRLSGSTLSAKLISDFALIRRVQAPRSPRVSRPSGFLHRLAVKIPLRATSSQGKLLHD